MNCNRCDFRADDLTEHAFESGHLLCIVCQRTSLSQREPQTCPTCVANVRADLCDLLDDMALLEPVSITAMTMLGDGTMQRLPRQDEIDRGIHDEWTSDPLPVLPALVSWEDYIREHYSAPKGAPGPTLAEVVDWLTSNLDSRLEIAQTFPAFDEFAAQVRYHHSAVKHTAGLADDPLPAKAECFDCGGDLVRTYAPPTVTEEKRHNRARRSAATVLSATKRQRQAERTYGIEHLTPWPTLTARQHAKLALLGEPNEGLIDTWTCTRCRRVYTQTDYFIGLRVAASVWVPVPVAAKIAERSVWTLRSWVTRMKVAAACRVSDKAMVVWWPDVSDRAFRHADDAESQESA